MKINEAMNILNLSGTVTQKEIKKAYKKLSLKFHPDRNPAGLHIMQVINEAYKLLTDLKSDVTMDSEFMAYDFGEVLNNVINELLKLEICGNWIWIDGETKQHAKRLGRKEGGIGCYWASAKKKWYYRPEEWVSSSKGNWDMEEIRDTHGSKVIKGNPYSNRSALPA